VVFFFPLSQTEPAALALWISAPGSELAVDRRPAPDQPVIAAEPSYSPQPASSLPAHAPMDHKRSANDAGVHDSGGSSKAPRTGPSASSLPCAAVHAPS
jgi:hypothetical protein